MRKNYFSKTIYPIYHGVVVITTAKLHSTKSKLRFCAGSNPGHGMSEICNGKNIWQLPWLDIRSNAFPAKTITSSSSAIYRIECFHNKKAKLQIFVFKKTLLKRFWTNTVTLNLRSFYSMIISILTLLNDSLLDIPLKITAYIFFRFFLIFFSISKFGTPFFE